MQKKKQKKVLTAAEIRARRSAAAKKGWITRRRNLKRKKMVMKKAAKFDGIKSFFKDKGMNQIYSSGIEMAFFNEKGQQCHPFAFCKDYFQDAVWAQLNNKTASIYGFSYNPKVNPKLDLEQMRLAVRDKTKDAKTMEERCKKSINFLNKLEKKMGFSPSELVFCGNYTNELLKKEYPVWGFIGDKRWLHSSVMISAYSLLLRVGMTYEGGSIEKHLESKNMVRKGDVNYVKRAMKGINLILSKGPEKIFAKKMEDNYPSTAACYDIHDYSGIVSFTEGHAAQKVKSAWQIKMP